MNDWMLGFIMDWDELLVFELGEVEGRRGWFIYIPKEYPQRSESAAIFINELKERISETGVVKNVHKPYHPQRNPRYQVSEKRAARIAYNIAKEKGYRVGKYRGPNE